MCFAISSLRVSARAPTQLRVAETLCVHKPPPRIPVTVEEGRLGWRSVFCVFVLWVCLGLLVDGEDFRKGCPLTEFPQGVTTDLDDPLVHLLSTGGFSRTLC